MIPQGKQWWWDGTTWRDAWNGNAPVEDGTSYDSEEFAAYEIILDVCGCVTGEVADALFDYLTWLDGTNRHTMPDPYPVLAAALADNHEFTEHGGSIYGAWLTDQGRAWMRLYEREIVERMVLIDPPTGDTGVPPT